MFNLSKKKIMAFAIAFTMLFASQASMRKRDMRERILPMRWKRARSPGPASKSVPG